MDKPIVALLYDFDKTLSPKDMQEYAFIPGLGLTAGEFWSRCSEMSRKNDMDQILAYMYLMLEEARGKMLLNRAEFTKLGASVRLFPGVETWFSRIDAVCEQLGLTPEHYILSSGLKEIIEGTSIARHFKRIYAAEFCYDDKGVPVWPAMAVNYTSKTQFLFRINKGVLDVNEHNGLNEFTPEQKRRIPFTNMIYYGDGLTDVPCMKLCKVGGGHSVAVYESDRTVAERMLREGRVDFIAPADYSKGSKLEQLTVAVLDHIAAYNKTVALHLSDAESAGL